jgi:hypothetical protein
VEGRIVPARDLNVETSVRRFGGRAAARLELDPQPRPTLEHAGGPHELLPRGGLVVGEIGAGPHGEGIGETHETVVTAQLGDQHGGIPLVVLTGFEDVVRRDREMTAAASIKQRAEERLGIEPWNAQPWDGPIAPDERRGGAVTDQTEVLVRQIPIAVDERSERGF